MAEVTISIYGFFSPFILRSGQFISLFLYNGDNTVLSYAADFVVYFGILFFPVFLMGTSLPIVTHALRKTMPGGAVIGKFYGLNIFGAAFGTLVTGFLLNPYFDMSDTVRFVAVGNFFISLLALLLLKIQGDYGDEVPSEKTTIAREKLNYKILFFSFIIGFIAIGYEIFFFRVFTFFFGANSYLFPIVLTGYLIHLGMGTYMAGVFIKKKLAVHKIIFIALSGTAITSVLTFLVPDFFQYVLGMKPGYDTLLWPSTPINSFYCSAVIMFVCMIPVMFISMLFPAITHIAVKDSSHFGYTVSIVYLVQTLGNFLGSLLTGYFLLLHLGTINTALLFSILLLLMASPLLLKSFLNITFITKNSKIYGVLLVFFCIQTWFINSKLYPKIKYPDSPEEIIEIKEGTIFIFDHRHKDIRIGVEPLAYAPVSTISLTNLWPTDIPLSMLKNEPKRVLLIGIGGGGMLVFPIYKIYPETHLDLVELFPIVIEKMYEQNVPDIKNMLDHSSIHYSDGLRFLHKNFEKFKGKFDIIQIGITHVTSSGAGNLFTKEFLSKIKQWLTKDGILSFNAYINAVKPAAEIFQNAIVACPPKGTICHAFFTDSPEFKWKNLQKNYYFKLSEIESILHHKITPNLTYIFSKEKIRELTKDFKDQTDNHVVTEYFLSNKISFYTRGDPRSWDLEKADLILNEKPN